MYWPASPDRLGTAATPSKPHLPFLLLLISPSDSCDPLPLPPLLFPLCSSPSANLPLLTFLCTLPLSPPASPQVTRDLVPKMEAAYYIHNFKGSRPGALFRYEPLFRCESLFTCKSLLLKCEPLSVGSVRTMGDAAPAACCFPRASMRCGAFCCPPPGSRPHVACRRLQLNTRLGCMPPPNAHAPRPSPLPLPPPYNQ